MIMAQARDYVIMVIVGSEGNEFSQKLTKETLDHPVFQAEFNNLVYLYLDQYQSRNFADKWNISTYPSVLYFDKSGKLIIKPTGISRRSYWPGLRAKLKKLTIMKRVLIRL